MWSVPPLCLANWTEFIAAHPDQEYASYVQTELLSSFRIGLDRLSVPLQSSTRNHPSACENEGQVRGYIAAEREAGHLMGPLCQSDLTRIHTSLIGLVPKSEPNQWRIIVDLSFPFGRSVNDGISSTLASVSYSSMDDAVQRILHLGKGSWWRWTWSRLTARFLYTLRTNNFWWFHGREVYMSIELFRLGYDLHRKFSLQLRTWLLGHFIWQVFRTKSTTSMIFFSWAPRPLK